MPHVCSMLHSAHTRQCAFASACVHVACVLCLCAGRPVKAGTDLIASDAAVASDAITGLEEAGFEGRMLGSKGKHHHTKGKHHKKEKKEKSEGGEGEHETHESEHHES